jgi:hypothetical protein
VTLMPAVLDRAQQCHEALTALGAMPPDAVAVLLVGSQARGWANPTSDYDFCIVTEQPFSSDETRTVGVPLDPPITTVREVIVAERRCELAYWTEGQIRQMLDKVSWSRFESTEASLKALVDVEQTLLERLATAVPTAGEEWLEATRRAVDESAFRAFITTFSISSAEGKLEDIVGMVEVNDLESAVLAARLALDHMVDALLDSHGVYGTGIPKWRMRRLRDLAHPVFSPERYWELITMTGHGAADAAGWVDAVVAQCQDLALEIEI